ncbi:MAG: AMP-binding protein [Mycobacterium sp.]
MTLIAAINTAFSDHADAEAITLGDVSWTYRELEQQALHCADWVSASTAAAHVGVVVDRSLGTYAAFLGVLLAGRTPVPLSPSHEAGNQAAISIAAIDLVVDATASEVHADLPFRSRVPHLDDAARDRFGRQQVCDPAFAYILLTSGSTGPPKGVPVKPSALLAYVDAAARTFGIGVGSRVSATFQLSFDVAMHDLFVTLLHGASLHLPVGREFLTPNSYVDRCRLTHWFSVPSVVRLAQQLEPLSADSLARLQVSIFAGEAMTTQDAREWGRAATNSVIHNLYGPTETTIGCMSYRLPADLEALPATSNGTVPIGRPLPGVEVDVRDTSTLDGGVRRELLVRGPQRFDGYLGNVERPAFIGPAGDAAMADATGIPDAWYRTGDAVTVLDSGDMVFAGRGDRQVKLNGHRVELGEVEYLVRSINGVAAAVAFVDVAGVLYVACEFSGSTADLRRLLRHALAPHLRPGRCLAVPALPLNANGKLDTSAVHLLSGWL